MSQGVEMLGKRASISVGTNALGFNVKDQQLYYAVMGTGSLLGQVELYRMGNDYAPVRLGAVLNSTGGTKFYSSTTGTLITAFPSGDFNPTTGLYIMNSNMNWFSVNITSLVATRLNITGTPKLIDFLDITFANNSFYGVSSLMTDVTSLIKIDTKNPLLMISSYRVDKFIKDGQTFTAKAQIPYVDDNGVSKTGYTGSGWGAAFSDRYDNLYFAQNADGSVWKFEIIDGSTARAVFIVDTGRMKEAADGASCKEAGNIFESPLTINTEFDVNNNPATMTVTRDVFINDVDCAGCMISPMAVVSVTSTANGTVQLFQNGTFLYMPLAGFAGVDQFTISIQDQFGRISIKNKTVTLNVYIDCEWHWSEYGACTCPSISTNSRRRTSFETQRDVLAVTGELTLNAGDEFLGSSILHRANFLRTAMQQHKRSSP